MAPPRADLLCCCVFGTPQQTLIKFPIVWHHTAAVALRGWWAAFWVLAAHQVGPMLTGSGATVTAQQTVVFDGQVSILRRIIMLANFAAHSHTTNS